MLATMSRTRISLLERLGRDEGDQSAWEEFVACYGPPIRAWCRRWQLQPTDAEDVTQLVLIKVAAKLRGFVYDPGRSFRAWLKTLARHVWCDFVAEQRHNAGGLAALDKLQTIPARDDLERSLHEAFDLELLEQATVRVRQRVKPATWEAFRLTAVEGLPGADAAARLEMQVAAVYMAKSNVLKLLRHEISDLLERVGPL